MKVDELYRQSRRATAIGAAVGLALGCAKLAGGVWGHSIALLSDSVHSFGDAGVAAAVLAALHGSEIPPDQEHPYGHTRLEAIAGSNVALLLALSAIWIIWESVTTFNEASPEPATFALWIAAASMVLNEVLYHYKRRVAQKTGSSTIRAYAWDHRLDAYTSLTVLLALALVRFGGPAYHAADHVAAVLVALVILWVATTLFWNSLQELMDRQAEPELGGHRPPGSPGSPESPKRGEASSSEERPGIPGRHPRGGGPGTQRSGRPRHRPRRQGPAHGADRADQGRAGAHRAGQDK